MKKFLAKEFLWFLLTIVLAVPLSFLWLVGLDIISADRSFSQDEKVFILELFLVAYLFSFAGIYLIRFVIGAIKSIALAE